MHFLCLHGTGTNSQVFETQTATIRYELDGHHTFEFVEGTIPCPIATEIKPYFSINSTYYQYYDQSSATSMRLALSQLDAYITSEGPFDGVIGYSQGASLAATYLLQFGMRHPGKALPFKCAIFFAGGVPLDPAELDDGVLRLVKVGELNGIGDKEFRLNEENVKETEWVLKLPTAHIYGRKDPLWPGSSEVLASLSERESRSVSLHDEGHDIPGARAKEAVQGAVRAIRRAIEKGLIEN